MRLRTCNNRRRAQAHHATTRASLKRVWARLEFTPPPPLGRSLCWINEAAAEQVSAILGRSMLDIGRARMDALMYGISAMKDGKRIAPEDLYVEPQP